MIKKRLIYLLLGITVLGAGCIKNDADNAPDIVAPQGKFAGKFYRIHYSQVTRKTDTVRLDVQMEMSGSTYQFTGDTSKHAGSKGTFAYNQSYIEWRDLTVPSGVNSVNLPKYHLHGVYSYLYNNTSLQIQASNDTLIYFYDFKKTAN